MTQNAGGIMGKITSPMKIQESSIRKKKYQNQTKKANQGNNAIISQAKG